MDDEFKETADDLSQSSIKKALYDSIFSDSKQVDNIN